MQRKNVFNWLCRSAVAVAVIISGADNASAGWGHHGWGGSSGGYGGSSGGWGGSSGGYDAGWGSSGGYGGSTGGWGGSSGGRRHHKLFHHHKRWGGSSGGGSSGGWGGSSGGYDMGWGGSSGGSSGGWGGSSGGSSGGGAFYAPSYDEGYVVPGSVVPSTTVPGTDANRPMGEGDAAPLPRGAAPTGDAPMSRINRADGTLVVEVPADAKIFVNDRPTTTPGEVREYISRNLIRGQNYSYQVRAEVERDGKIVSETKRIDVRAGEHTRLAFDMKPAAEVATSITLKVPADAKVSLAGNDTSATGDVRVYRTDLKAGTEWKDYKVVVTMEIDGNVITKEQTFDLAAGDNKELAFDFDVTNVAAR